MAKSGMERRGGVEGRRGDPKERERPPFPWDRNAAKARRRLATTARTLVWSQAPWPCSGRDNRPEIPAQPIDIMDSAPGNPIAAEAPGGADAERSGSRASAPAVPLGSPRRQSPSQDWRLQRPSAARDDGAETGLGRGALALLGRDNRPEIPAQPIDIMDSAPGNPIAAEAPGGADAERSGSRASAPAVPLGSPRRQSPSQDWRLQRPSAARDDGAETGLGPGALALLGRDNRPEISSATR